MTLNLRDPNEAEYTSENVRTLDGISGLGSCRIPRAAEATEAVSASLDTSFNMVTLIAAREAHPGISAFHSAPHVETSRRDGRHPSASRSSRRPCARPGFV